MHVDTPTEEYPAVGDTRQRSYPPKAGYGSRTPARINTGRNGLLDAWIGVP